MGSADADLRLQEVLGRWDRRLAEATVAWHQLPAGERRRRQVELDLQGETDEWVVVLWSWWERSSLTEQAQLRDDVRLLTAALRGAERDGFLEGGGEEAEAGRHLLEALARTERILGVDPLPPGAV